MGTSPESPIQGGGVNRSNSKLGLTMRLPLGAKQSLGPGVDDEDGEAVVLPEVGWLEEEVVITTELLEYESE